MHHSKTLPTQKHERFDEPGSLMKATKALIEKDGRTHYEMATEIGIPFHWLSKFMSGEIKAPSVNRVQFLYEKLSGKKISI